MIWSNFWSSFTAEPVAWLMFAFAVICGLVIWSRRPAHRNVLWALAALGLAIGCWQLSLGRDANDVDMRDMGIGWLFVGVGFGFYAFVARRAWRKAHPKVKPPTPGPAVKK